MTLKIGEDIVKSFGQQPRKEKNERSFEQVRLAIYRSTRFRAYQFRILVQDFAGRPDAFSNRRGNPRYSSRDRSSRLIENTWRCVEKEEK